MEECVRNVGESKNDNRVMKGIKERETAERNGDRTDKRKEWKGIRWKEKEIVIA
jgi:hypothetical protein